MSKVDVLSYTDSATAIMPSDAKPTRVTEIVLNPVITVVGADVSKVQQLVEKAHRECYISNTVNAQITINADIKTVDR